MAQLIDEPSFLRLPPELHLYIASFLTFPDNVHLKLTCTYLNDLIPSLTHVELLEAECTSYAASYDLWSCRYCLRLRPESKFADRMLRRGRGRLGRDAGKRFCVDCGIQPRSGEARYGPGAQIMVQGGLYVICLECRMFGPCRADRFGKGTPYCVNCSLPMPKKYIEADEGSS